MGDNFAQLSPTSSTAGKQKGKTMLYRALNVIGLMYYVTASSIEEAIDKFSADYGIVEPSSVQTSMFKRWVPITVERDPIRS
jgi:hypothetical protein